MPTMSSFLLPLLFLLLLFISIHSCHGHLLRNDQIHPAENKRKQSIESNSLKREWRNFGGAATTEQSLKDGKTTSTSAKVDQDHAVKAVVSGAVRIQSHVSVSWPVPHMEKHKGHPGFNVDYAGPKTHPPSHN